MNTFVQPNPFKVSAGLRAVLAQWLKDASLKSPPGRVSRYGLCNYVLGAGGQVLYLELLEVFKATGMDWACPFDPACNGGYFEEKDKAKNPARVAFVQLVLAMNSKAE